MTGEISMKQSVLAVILLGATSMVAQQPSVTKVRTALNHLTVIEAPEPITMAAAGSVLFEIERHGNRVFVKPVKSGASTNLFVWTEHARCVYELETTGDVGKMDVYVTQTSQPVAVMATTEPASSRDVRQNADVVSSQTLLKTERVNTKDIKLAKDRVSVTFYDAVRSGDALIVRYRVTNRGKDPYRIVPPTVSALAHSEEADLSPLRNVQLSEGMLARYVTNTRTAVPIVRSEVEQTDVAPGKSSVGVLAIHPTGDGPQIYQFVFAADSKNPILASAVL
jgi:hypothetical protein